MRILFYLPVVTPWWFDNIVGPMIRAAARGGEVYVLVPPMWQGTGIGPEQLARVDDIEGVHWVILDGEDHPRIRTSALGEQDLIDFVRELAPDLVLCRSADIETPKLFPGCVRYITEAAAPPFTSAPTMVWLSETLFDHGMMPDLDAGQRRRLERIFSPMWLERSALLGQIDRESFFRAAGLPLDVPVIGMPLEYMHPEMFVGQHDPFDGNIGLIDHVAGHMGDDAVLAVTNHPLNELHCDNRSLYEAITRHGGKVKMVGKVGVDGLATTLLAQHADGMVLGNSKCFAPCGFFGTPMLRLSRFRTGAWMNAYDAPGPFLADVVAGRAVGADPADARAWFGWHLLNNSFDPQAPALDAAALAQFADGGVDESRWLARRDVLSPAVQIAA